MRRLLKRSRAGVAGLAVALVVVAAIAAGAILLAGGGGRSRDPAGTRAGADSAAASPTDAPLRAHPRLSEPEAGITAEQAIQADPAYQAAMARKHRTRPPTLAEVRRQLRQLQRYYARHPQATVDLSNALLPGAADLTGFRTSIASVFTDFGLPIACPGGPLGRTQLGVAHKTLPCGTQVTFRYKGRAIRVPVIDRGPYIAGREWDLTGATAIALHFPGLGPIEWKIG
ncbi:MAG TPA: septal ring lytic transglycosylase RlpA family protein [Solirubrobacteraceae bacterium]|nr:septal ring lytic transglycosylase RlpA family protein [Solirubrobacteraceae bacterium]